MEEVSPALSEPMEEEKPATEVRRLSTDAYLSLFY